MAEAKFTRTKDAYVPPPQPAPSPAPQPAPTAPAQPSVTPGAAGEVTLVLPDKRAVVLKDPGVATQFAVYRILAAVCPGDNAPTGLVITIKSLFYIRSIDGVNVAPPYDHVEAQVTMNKLGDAGMEFVASAYLQHFMLQKASLPLSGR
jgi:hypothetical protein